MTRGRNKTYCCWSFLFLSLNPRSTSNALRVLKGCKAPNSLLSPHLFLLKPLSNTQYFIYKLLKDLNNTPKLKTFWTLFGCFTMWKSDFD
ncbi:unnamed protein product [Lactuca virosa]|uniref:Uncharacterized protein n=1 Tax=Lactuca virosa TaxID=75947 RepID=A0AAU9MN63_9ASTR|nr:unnamed protein product [Lactuca virosa]